MTFFNGLIVYAIIWVVVLFFVLPWGVRVPEKFKPGHATSAPEAPLIGLKVLITSLIAALLWIVAYLILRK